MKIACTLTTTALIAASAHAATTVSVVELGNGGVTRVTSNSNQAASTTVSGVTSFWGAMHDIPRPTPAGKRNLSTTDRRKAGITTTKTMQESGMSMVPDMFQRADGGLALALIGDVDDLLKDMPTLAELTQKQRVGSFSVKGQKAVDLIAASFADEGVTAGGEAASVIKAKIDGAAEGNKLQGAIVEVDDGNAKKVDAQLKALVSDVQNRKGTGTFVLHVVTEDGVRRRLNEDEDENDRDEDEYKEEDNSKDEEEDNENEDGEDDGSQSDNYRTIFQIQYFNTVLWTALGLVTVLVYCIGLMINMPLMADTLLFGESAKMIG